jgi:internalin A
VDAASQTHTALLQLFTLQLSTPGNLTKARFEKVSEKESKIKSKVSKANGFLLVTKDNQARLKISGEYENMEMVSSGKQMKWAAGTGEARSWDQAKVAQTPKGLHGLSGLVGRNGVTLTYYMTMPILLKYGAIGWGHENDENSKPRDFKAGAAEKVGGRDTKVLSYKYGKGDKDAIPVTVWLDAKTLLPLKRVVVSHNLNMHITEIYTEFKLDPKIEAKAFDLVPSPGNEAEKLLRAVEKKIKAAKAVEVTFDIDIKGKGKGAQARLKGSVLFTKDKKARLKISGNAMGKEMTIEMISDGKRMKMAESPDTITKAEAARTRPDLHSLLSAMVSGPGLLHTYGDLSPGPPAPTFRLVYFNGGAAEKVGGRDAKVVTYDAVLLGETCQVTLWIDAKTMLPLKRLIVYEGNGKPGRLTEICNFNLNPKVDAGAFAFQGQVKKSPAKGIDAATVAAYEKLGAVYGGWTKSNLGFQIGQKHAEEGLPGFAFFETFPKVKLPEVAVPFGLELSMAHVTDAGLKGLAHLKNLTTLELFQTPVTDAGLKELAPLKNLTELNLYNTRVTDLGLKELASLKNLTTLDLSSTKVTDAGLKALAPLKNLTELNLSSTKVTGAGLKELAPLNNLTTLGLGDAKVTDAELKELTPLKNLTTLDLASTKVTDAGLKELTLLKKLASLVLAGTKVTDAGLKELAPFKKLASLDLSDTKVTDAGLKALAPLKNLTTLDLISTQVTDTSLRVLREIGLLHALSLATGKDGSRPKSAEAVIGLYLKETKVTDAGLKEFVSLKNLSSLNLDGTQVTGTGLKALAPLKSLATLNLNNTGITDAGLKELATLKNLSSLDLDATQVTGTGLKALAPLKNLATLNLNNTGVTDAGLKELAPLKNLASLFLIGTKVTDAGLKELTPLKNLDTLYVDSTQVTDVGLKTLAPLNNLTTLGLSSTQVTDAGLKKLTPLKNLTALRLTDTQVTDAGLKALTSLKNLTMLWLKNTKVTDTGAAELRKALPRCVIFR